MKKKRPIPEFKDYNPLWIKKSFGISYREIFRKVKHKVKKKLGWKH